MEHVFKPAWRHAGIWLPAGLPGADALDDHDPVADVERHMAEHPEHWDVALRTPSPPEAVVLVAVDHVQAGIYREKDINDLLGAAPRGYHTAPAPGGGHPECGLTTSWEGLYLYLCAGELIWNARSVSGCRLEAVTLRGVVGQTDVAFLWAEAGFGSLCGRFIAPLLAGDHHGHGRSHVRRLCDDADWKIDFNKDQRTLFLHLVRQN